MSLPVEAETPAPLLKSSGADLLTLIKQRPQIVLSPLFALLFFGGWEYACRAYKISQLIIPAPSQIIVALVEGLRSGQLLDGLLTTLQEVVLGFALAAISAFIIGTLISQNPPP